MTDALRICIEEFEAADRVCRQWSKIYGFAVWREGHPLDRMKLLRRRRTKLDLKRALAGAPAAGRG